MEFTVAARNTPLWHGAAALVQRTYTAAFGATTFSKPDAFLVASRVQDGTPVPLACAGMNYGEQSQFFAETYLDEAAEQEITCRFDLPCERPDVMEIGPIASEVATAGSELCRILPIFVWGHGKRYALCTLTRKLESMLSRLGYEFHPMALAVIDRLPEDEREQWGAYYDHGPCTGMIRIDTLAHAYTAGVGRYRFGEMSLSLSFDDEPQEPHLALA